MRTQAGRVGMFIVAIAAIVASPNFEAPVAASAWQGFSLVAGPSQVQNGTTPSWAAGVTTDLGSSEVDIWSNNHIFDSEAFIDVASANPSFSSASQYGATALIDTHGVLFTDLDGDGDEDLVETMGRQNLNRVFRNDGGSLTPISPGAMGDFIGRGRQPLAVDVDADGDMDVLVTNLDLRQPPVNSPTNSPSRVYLNNGSGTAWTVAPNAGGALSDGNLRLAQQTSTGPGTPQIIVTHNSFTVATDSIATGTTSLQQAVTPATVRANVSHVRDAVIGDFDGDLHPELVIARGNASASAGAWPLQIFDLVQGASPVAVPALPVDPLIDNCRSVAAGDFDNDGDLDIFGGCSHLQDSQLRNVVLLNDGSGDFTIADTSVLASSGSVTAAGLAVADLDADGWLDLWIGNGYDAETASDHLAMNNGGVGSYLSVNLHGSNPDAAGAQVFAGTTSWQVRESGHRTRRGQDQRALHFGLGVATEIAPLEIMWPDGSFESCDVGGVANQFVDVYQGGPNCVGRSKTEFLAVLAAAPAIEPVPSCDGFAPTVDLGAGDAPTTGDDVILGTSGADMINGLAGDDVICGLGGDDIINGGNGEDTIFGGDGDDRVSGQGGVDTIFGEAGNDLINGGVGADVIHGGDGDDDLRGQGGQDTLNGDGGVDQFFGGSGNDVINTGEGGNAGTSQVVRGQSNNDTITGSSGADVLEGGPGLDIINGGDGGDTLKGGLGSDRLFGENGNDTLEGGATRDFLYGGDGDDTLKGGTGDDDLFGEAGSDALDGQGDTDTCDGGADADTATPACETLVDIP